MSKILCPICSESFDKFKTHIVKGHKLGWLDFLAEFGDYPVCSPEFSLIMKRVGSKADKEKIKESLKRAFSSPEYKKKRASLTKKQWDNPEFKNMMVDVGKDTYQRILKNNPNWVKSGENNPLRQYLLRMHNGEYPDVLEKMKEGRRQYNQSDLCVKRLNEHWSDPDKIEEARNRAKQNNRGTLIMYSKLNGENIKLRSKLEYKIAEVLDKYGLEWEYERVIIPYIFNNQSHNYITDFYLPKYHVLLEVKPKFAQSDSKAIAKMEASIKEGYRYFFVENSEKLEEILEKV